MGDENTPPDFGSWPSKVSSFANGLMFPLIFTASFAFWGWTAKRNAEKPREGGEIVPESEKEKVPEKEKQRVKEHHEADKKHEAGKPIEEQRDVVKPSCKKWQELRQFAEKWCVIKKVRKWLPEEEKLNVKEHPEADKKHEAEKAIEEQEDVVKPCCKKFRQFVEKWCVVKKAKEILRNKGFLVESEKQCDHKNRGKEE